MRLAYVCLDPGVPVFGRKGSSIHCQEILRNFLKKGYEIDLFARRLGDDVPDDLAEIGIHRIGGKLSSDPKSREKQLADTNPVVLQMIQNAGPFDLVYERYSLWHKAGMQFAKENNIPGILEVNSPLIHEQKNYRTLIDESNAKSNRACCFKNATSIIAVSEEVAVRVRNNYHARDKTHVVANGVNCKKFQRFSLGQRSHGEFLTIGFLGTLKPWHGVSTLIDAFAIAFEQRKNIRLQIVGDGPEREKLQTRVHRYGSDLQSAVQWLGAVSNDQVPKILADFDIAVAPYPDIQDFYFSPLKILEYMAAGLPIVASNIGQIPKLIDDGHSGILVQSGDEEALAEKIMKLCNNPKLRQMLGRTAMQKATSNHQWSQVLQRILDTVSIRFNTHETRCLDVAS